MEDDAAVEILKPGFPQQLGKASPTTLGFPTSPHRSGDDHHQLNLLTDGWAKSGDQKWAIPGGQNQLALAWPAGAFAQDLAGTWIGNVRQSDSELAVTMIFEVNYDGNWIGRIDIPEWGARLARLRNIEMREQQVSFDVEDGIGRRVNQRDCPKCPG